MSQYVHTNAYNMTALILITSRVHVPHEECVALNSWLFSLHIRSGEPLHWKELCRIRHLPTRKYLAVVKVKDSYEVTLKARSGGTRFEKHTTFRLVPVVERDDDVNFESYARIYHVDTNTWLHALKGKCPLSHSGTL